MTMPAYQNCQHQGDGWCLACVGKLAEELSITTSELIRANGEIVAMKQMAEDSGTEKHSLVCCVSSDGFVWFNIPVFIDDGGKVLNTEYVRITYEFITKDMLNERTP